MSLPLRIITGLLFLPLMVCGVGQVRAEVTLEIIRTGAEKIPVGILPIRFQGIPAPQEQTFYEILRKDLNSSRVIQPVKISGTQWKFQNPPGSKQIKLLNAQGVVGAVWAGLHKTPKDYRLDGYSFDVSTGKPILERRYIGQLRSAERQIRLMIHRFADELVYRFTGERGIAQTRIAYTSDQTGYKEIYIMDYDGYHPRRITGDRSIALTPRWSPDNRFLAYVSYRDGQPNITIHELATARRIRLTKFPGMTISPNWSPQGDRIAFVGTRDGNTEIYVADVTGLTQRMGGADHASDSVRRITFSRADDISPSWSPTGQQIAFTSNRGGTPQIYLMNTDGTSVRRLTFEGSYNTTPAWSPRGDWVAYTCRRERTLKICLISPDGRALLHVTDGPQDDEAPSWSPDGRSLVFSSMRRGESHLYMITSGGRDEEQLTHTAFDEWAPGWSWN